MCTMLIFIQSDLVMKGDPDCLMINCIAKTFLKQQKPCFHKAQVAENKPPTQKPNI